MEDEIRRAAHIDSIIAHLEYELENDSNPKFEVLIACLTMDPSSDYMLKNYGRHVIGFDPIIQALAYSVPDPFSRSMLSAVAYDPQIARACALDIAFGVDLTSSEVALHLSGLSQDEKVASISVWIVEELCSLAANLKEEKWSTEREWRLKSVRSHYGALSRNAAAEPRPMEFFQMPKAATFIDPEKKKYLHNLSMFGMLPINKIGLDVTAPIPKEVPQALDKYLPFGEQRIGAADLPRMVAALEALPD